MSRTDAIEVEGTIVEALPRAVYRIELVNGHRLLAHLSARVRRLAPVLAPGGKVMLELSPFDLSRGRIVGNEKEL